MSGKKRAKNAAPKRKGRKVASERAKAHLQGMFNPVRGLTPQRLVTMLDEFDAGHLRDLARLMDLVEARDDTLMAVAPKRKKAVSRYGWEILTVDFDSQDKRMAALAEKQVDALTFFYNNLTATSVTDQDEQGGTSLLFRQMMDAVGKRYSVHEIEWQKRGAFYTANFWHTPLSFFEATTGKLRFISEPLGTDGQEMKDGEWLVTVGQGITIVCAILYYFKLGPRNAWIRFCEKFGMPGVHGETNAPHGSKEWKQMVAAVSNFVNDWAAVTSVGEKFNLIEAKGGTGNLPHPPLLESVTRAMVMLWRGGDLGTMSKDDGVGASVQEGETDLLEQDDAGMIGETLNIKVDRKVIEYTFGPNVPMLAYIRILTKDRQNIDQELKIDEFLLAHKFPVSLKSVSERYSRPIPEDDEELLEVGSGKPDVGSEEELPGPKDVKEKAAANEATRKVADGLGVPVGWLSPVMDLIAGMEAKAADDSLSDAELREFLQKSQARLPELLGDMDTTALAEALEPVLGAAAMKGVREQAKSGRKKSHAKSAKDAKGKAKK